MSSLNHIDLFRIQPLKGTPMLHNAICDGVYFPRKRLFVMAMAWVVLCSAAKNGIGNDLTHLELILDGSSQPPGDRVLVSATLFSEVKDAHLELRAYLVSGKGNIEQSPVLGRGKNVDEQGIFFVALDASCSRRVHSTRRNRRHSSRQTKRGKSPTHAAGHCSGNVVSQNAHCTL